MFVDRKAGFSGSTGPKTVTFGGAQSFRPSGTLQPPNIDNSPIAFEKSKSWPIVRFLLTLLVIAGLMYFFLHR